MNRGRPQGGMRLEEEWLVVCKMIWIGRLLNSTLVHAYELEKKMALVGVLLRT